MKTLIFLAIMVASFLLFYYLLELTLWQSILCVVIAQIISSQVFRFEDEKNEKDWEDWKNKRKDGRL